MRGYDHYLSVELAVSLNTVIYLFILNEVFMVIYNKEVKENKIILS